MKKETNQFLVFIYALISIFICFLILSIIATQFLAYKFNYSPALGETMAYGLYFPFAWITWSFKYYNFYPDLFNKLFALMAFGAAISFLMFAVIRLTFLRKGKPIEDLHGSAHWANLEEIKQMGILGNNKGVYIGGYKLDKVVEYLRHSGPEHVIVFAPTRSGKGVCIIVPTLLSWAYSVIVADVKRELYNLTAAWRKKYANNVILKFDPTCTDGSATRFNILEEIGYRTIYEIKDAQNIAINIVYKGETPPSDPKLGSTSYFKSEAASFLAAFILFVYYQRQSEGKATPGLSDLYKFLNNPENSIDLLLEDMSECDFEDIDINTKEFISSAAGSMKNKASAELSGVRGTTSEVLNLYADPIVAKNTSKSDFKIDDLMNHDKPVSLYLVLPAGDKDRLKPLFNLIINQILRKLTDKELKFKDGQQVASYKHRLLFLGDELPIFGKISTIEENLAYAAGYGIKFLLSIQDLKQLYGAYGRDESIISNCNVRIAFAPNQLETAKALSEMSGTTTIVKKQITVSGKRTSVVLGNVSEIYQEVQRPLMTPDECMRIKPAKKDKKGNILEAGDMVIFISGNAPIYGRQILYFQDEAFLQRTKLPPVNPDKILL